MTCGLLLLAISTQTTAQQTRVGLQLGVSSSRLADDFITDSYRHGVTAGLMVERELTGKVHVETGVAWIEEGSKGTVQGFEEPVPFDVRLAYVQVPVLLRLTPWATRIRPSVAIGGAVSAETRCANGQPDNAPAILILCDRQDRPSTDYSLLVAGGATYDVGRVSILLEGRFDHGLRDLDGIDEAEAMSRGFALVTRFSVPLHL
jgi:hypothetical protein